MPNTAVSRPCGHGPSSGRPLTKCWDAVGIGAARPLSAVAEVGISGFFLDMNMVGLLILVWRTYKRRRRISHPPVHHVWASPRLLAVTPLRASGEHFCFVTVADPLCSRPRP